MKTLVRFLRRYKLFSLALLALAAALLLQATKHKTAAHWILGAVSIGSLLPLLAEMWRDIRTGRYGIDILAATAVIASVALGEFWAAIVVIIMLAGGESLENYAERRAKSELDELLKQAPQTAKVIRKGRIIEVKVDEIHVGEKLVINAGDTVPVDAVVLEGAANFDESALTGESLPQLKEKDHKLISGAINQDGSIKARAVAAAEDSQYQQIIKLVKGASAHQAPFVRLADRYSIPFTVLAYAIALAVWIATGEAIRFLEVIIVATPCPLLLAAPIAVVSGMSRASRYGIIIKSGRALERMADAAAIAFDKTGTLTTGRLAVDEIIAFGSFKKADVLALAASLEQGSNHVVAQAVVDAAIDHKVKYARTKHVREVPGQGLVAQLKGKRIVVGRLSLLEQHGISLPPKLQSLKLKKTVVYVSVEDSLAGLLTLSDEVRAESHATIERLNQLKLKNIMMVTGDSKATAQAVAKDLDIPEVYYEALPADKLSVIDKAERPLVFVGDGVNDAPVLTAADVGIALGARGSAAASESADMVIMTDNVNRVATAYEISKRTLSIATQSVFIGIGLSIGLMLVFASGRFSPLAGAIIQEGVDVLVIINALRAHSIKISDPGQE